MREVEKLSTLITLNRTVKLELSLLCLAKGFLNKMNKLGSGSCWMNGKRAISSYLGTAKTGSFVSVFIAIHHSFQALRSILTKCRIQSFWFRISVDFAIWPNRLAYQNSHPSPKQSHQTKAGKKLQDFDIFSYFRTYSNEMVF